MPAGLASELTIYGQSLGLLAALGLAIFAVHRGLLAFYSNKPNHQYLRQLIMVCVCLLVAVLAVVLLPVDDSTQGQLLGFLAILLGITIALSSATLVGNAMAGLVLNSLRKCRCGDYLQAGEHFGRITNVDLLRVEIENEDHDSISLPNLYFVTNPVRMLRSSGTILHVNVALGYEVPRQIVEAALLRGAESAGLDNPTVQIRKLGEAAVTYQVAGRLAGTGQLQEMRGKLRASALDELQAAGIEMAAADNRNTRNSGADTRALPAGDTDAVVASAGGAKGSAPEPVPAPARADKARLTEELATLKKDYTDCSQELIGVERQLKEAGQGDERQPLNLLKKKLEARLLRTDKEIRKLETARNG